MASIERTAYPRFKRYFKDAELKEIYTPTAVEIAFGLANATGPTNHLGCLVLLKTFQRLGYFPKINEIPHQIIKHIRDYLKLPSDITLEQMSPRTLSRLKGEIRAYLKVSRFNRQALRLITETVEQSASIMDNPADLINVAIETLVKNYYELPGFNTLNRLVCQLRNSVNQNLFAQTTQALEPKYIKQLEALLEINPSEQRSSYNDLKKLPKKSSRNHIDELLVHLAWLESLGDVSPYLKGINTSKIHHWAAEAKALDASEIRKFNQPKQLTLLLCLIHGGQVNTRDSLLTMFLKQIQRINNKAKDELQLLRQKLQDKVEVMISVFNNVLQVFADESRKDSWNEQVFRILTESGGVEHLLIECDTINAYKGNNYLPLVWRFYKSQRSVFFRLVNALKFESTSKDQSLINALNFLLLNASKRGEWLSPIDLSFATSVWQKFVLVRQDEQLKMSRRHFEVCVFFHLANELRSGDICVQGSQEYADYRQQLLPWSQCEPLVSKYCQSLNLPSNGDDFVQALKCYLEDTANRVDREYPQNTQVVINEQGEPVLKRYASKAESDSLKVLETLISQRMPERNLIDILKNVDYWTNFTRHFGPLSGSDPKLEQATERYLLTVFTYGCNLGPYQAARHMRGAVTPHMLSFVNRRHISLSKLNAALVDLLNRYNLLSLPKYWGDGTSAAADGTKYDLYEENLLSEYHIRYGGYGGIAYHHIADTYIRHLHNIILRLKVFPVKEFA